MKMKRKLCFLIFALLATIVAPAASPVAGLTNCAQVVVSGYTDTSAQDNFPLLVRISESRIPGFRYSDVAADGSNIRFCSMDGFTLYPFEVDTWNPGGESFVWVKIPQLTASFSFFFNWGADGSSLAANQSTDVWNDYVGVWHMSEEIPSNRASGTPSLDATANRLDARPMHGSAQPDPRADKTTMVSVPGIVGNGRRNSPAVEGFNLTGRNGLLVDANAKLNVGNKFTISGWIKVEGRANASSPMVVFARRKTSLSTGGWRVLMSDTLQDVSVYGEKNSGAKSAQLSETPLPDVGWVYCVVVYNNTSVQVYCNGNRKLSATLSAAATDVADLGLGFGNITTQAGPSFAGCFDEVRYRSGATNDRRLASEYENMANPNYCTIADVYANGDNGWLKEPTISKTAWEAGESAATIDLGRPIDGTVSVSYFNIGTEETSPTMPTEKGRYYAVFTVAATDAAGPLEVRRYFHILKTEPYLKLGSDRVLTFSRDATVAGATVDDPQHCTNKNKSNAVYWNYLNNDAVSNSSVPQLQNGYQFEMWTKDDVEKIWTLDFVRQGNTYKNSVNTGSMIADQNYLPVSTASYRYNSASDKASQYRYGAHASLQNTTNAVIMSSLYSQGIGTIYLDAVNGWTSVTNSLVVEVCTNVYELTREGEISTDVYGRPILAVDDSGHPLPPSDEVIWRTIPERTEGGITYPERIDPGGRGAWFPVPVTVYTIQNGVVTGTPRQESGAITLNCTTGGSNQNFFRIRTDKLDIRGPARFRIRRTDNAGNEQERMDTSYLDRNGLCLIDNVICSYPAMMAKVEQYGTLGCAPQQYGVEMTSETALGSRGAFSVAYPSHDETNLLARARIVYDTYTNSPPGLNYDLREFVGHLTIRYRWRYLDQIVGDWMEQSLDMVSEDPTQWQTMAPLDPAVFANGPGDIEYRIHADFRAPFYQFCDYTGLNIGLGPDGFSEAISENDLGTPWTDKKCGFVSNSEFDSNYIRLREGKSNVGEMEMWWILDGVTNIVEMKLVGNDQWVGYAPTPKTESTSRKGRVYFWARDILEDGQLDNLAGRETKYRPRQAVDSVPEDMGVIVEDVGVSVENAPEISADGGSAYLEFTVSPKMGTFAVSRADYQDFDSWTTAIDKTLFSGNLTETNSVSGSVTKTPLKVSDFPVAESANPNWAESFSVEAGQKAEAFYPRNEDFNLKRSRLGWTAENGKWMWEQFRKVSDSGGSAGGEGVGDGSAFQMHGRGLGSLSYINAPDFPKGVDTISCSLRLAQTIEFGDISYDYGADDIMGSHLMMTNYTITTKAAFTRISGVIDSDNAATLSLVGYYVPMVGCYEFRVIRVDEKKIRLELHKWTVGETGGIDDTLLGAWDTPAKDMTDDNNSWVTRTRLDRKNGELAGLFLSVGTEVGTENEEEKTVIRAGIGTKANGFPDDDAAFLSSGASSDFLVVHYEDSAADRLTRGTYGYLFTDCHGQFSAPYVFDKCVAAPAAENEKDAPGYPGFTYTEAAVSVTMPGTEVRMLSRKNQLETSWALRAGRVEALFNSLDVPFGVQSKTNFAQKVMVEVSPHGEGNWRAVATNLVSSFKNQSFPSVVHDSTDCDVRFKMGGKYSDSVVTDVIIDNVNVTQWRGQDTEGIGDSSSYGKMNQFVHTCAWVTNSSVAAAGRTIVLQPVRGTYKVQTTGEKKPAPISVRSPLMAGMGLFNFSWRNADSNCKLLVQIATNDVIRGEVVRLTQEPAESENWTTIDTLDFATMTPAQRLQGERTELINIRAPQNVIARVIIASDVVRAALSGDTPRTNVGYGAIEITDGFSWDLPAYDDRSWTGWNFRTEGWEGAEWGGVSSAYANLWDGRDGLSGILNNTLDTATLKEKNRTYYAQNPPHVQSPTYTTNFIGQVRFRARLDNKDDFETGRRPAVVTVWGSNEVNPDTGEPKSWQRIDEVVVSNQTYRLFTVKCKGTDSFLAVRLGVRGVDGVTGEAEDPLYSPPNRVALDTISVTEQVPPSLRFKLNYVRPFRDSQAIQKLTEVADIADESEQPMLMEAFGFQAELELQKLAEDILVDDPAYPITVDLCYYPYEEPWGYENWRTNELARRVRLVRAEGTDRLVFRSSYQKGASIVEPLQALPGKRYRVVQYHLIAQYYDKAHDLYPHELSAQVWKAPSWYLGFPDPNGGGKPFSAYTILDTILPHRAWINEASYMESSKTASVADQRIELAVPAGIDMTGWKVRLYDYEHGLLGTIATFGNNGCRTVTKTENQTNHYAFLTLKSPMSKTAADNTWSAISKTLADGTLEYTNPYGIELVRPSGVIESQVVFEGDSAQNAGYWYAYYYSGTNLVADLTERYGGNWVFGGKEEKRDLKSVGVVQNHAVESTDWQSPMDHTFGMVNAGQTIDPGWHREPNGDYVFIYVSATGGHISQQLGTETDPSVVAAVMTGGGTNITYTTARWYQLAPLEITVADGGTIVTNLVDRGRNDLGERTYELRLSQISNRVDLIARAEPDASVVAKLDAPDSDYRPAIMAWLENGVTRDAFGNEVPFASSELKPFYYVRGSGLLQELSLTTAYWLDVDPTEDGWYLLGNMGEYGGGTLLGRTPEPVSREYGATLVHTNLQMSLWMALSNGVSGVVHAPYRLQGLGGERSDDPATYQGGWTSVTMKVTGKLQNNQYIVDPKTGVTNFVNQIARPLRYFIFDRNSFYENANAEGMPPYSARVEVTDPFSRQSPAVDWGWYNWKDNATTPVFMGWGIDRQVTPAGVSVLKKQDTYDR